MKQKKTEMSNVSLSDIFKKCSMESNDNKITKLSGKCEYLGTVFEYSVNRQETTGQYLYRGSVRVLDIAGNVMKKRGKEREKIINREKEKLLKKGENVEDGAFIAKIEPSKFNIKADVYCSTDNIVDIKKEIFDTIKNLHFAYKSTINSQLAKDMRPDKITPFWAVQKKGKAYVFFEHKDASADTQKTLLKRLNNVTETMDQGKAMCSYTESSFSKFATENQLNDDTKRELRKFWDYCIKTGICTENKYCSNPVKIAKYNKDKNKKNQKGALVRSDLDFNEQNELYEKLSTMNPVVAAGIALMISGFNAKLITSLKWCDIEFKREADFVIVHYQREGAAGATKDYSRPVVPRSAPFIRNLNKSIRSKKPNLNLADHYVMEYEGSNGKPYHSQYLVQDATRLLTDIGISYAKINMVHEMNVDNASAARTMLYNTYERNIITKCNLNKNSGTARYLLGKAFKADVTSDAYTDFRNAEGLRRLYNIMQILREPRSIRVTCKTKEDGNVKTIEFLPERSDEYSTVHGYIGPVEPGTIIRISAPHGVEGVIKGVTEKQTLGIL